MKVGAVILAGGNGVRFGANVPKQFVNLNGKQIWRHAYDAFKNHPLIEGNIVVVFPEHCMEEALNSGLTLNIAMAGKTRRESSYNGLKALRRISNCTHVLIHDAARPLVSKEIIGMCVDALRMGNEACDVVVPSPDTIVKLLPSKKAVGSVLKRDELRLGQTPQGFALDRILEAHAAVSHLLEFTDDLGIMLARESNVRVAAVEGDERNMKITTQADLIRAERLARMAPEQRVTVYPGNALILGYNGGIGSEVTKLLRDETSPVTMLWGSKECPLEGEHERLDGIEPGFLRYLVVCTGSLKETHPDKSIVPWTDEFETNFTNVVRFLAKVKRLGIMAKGGSIVVLGSSSAYQGRGGYTAYSAAKAALVNFVQGYAEEWPDVHLNIVNPGRTNTAMRRKMFPNEDPGTLLEPEEAALRVVRVLGMECTGCVFDIRAQGIGA